MTGKNFSKFLKGVLFSLLMLAVLPVSVWAAEKEPVILYTNDVHCAIEDYSELVAYAAQLESDGHEVLIVDVGDAIQGEVIGSQTEGSAIIDLMNTVGYDYAVPGNHEFDYGMSTFLELAEDENNAFEYVCANLVNLETNSTVFDAYKVVELGGEKIAILGLTTPESLTKSNPTYFQDEDGNVIYSFSQGSEPADFYAAIQNAVDQARAAGADRVIVIGHLGIADTTDGWKSTDVIANTTGIDVFLDAHSHEVITGDVYKNEAQEDVLLSSTGTKFAYFGKLTLKSDGAETTELIDPETVDENSSEAAKAAYTEVQDKIDAYNADITYLYEKIGTSEVKLVATDGNGNRIIRAQETNLANFVTDAYRALTGADIAIANSGGIRADILAGNVSRKSFMDVNPFNNTVVVVKATGQEILDALEFGAHVHPELNAGLLQTSGLSYEIHNYLEDPVILNDGSFVKVDETKERRVANVKINGIALNPEKEYTVASSAFLLKDGGDGFTMFKDNEVVKEEGLPTDAEMLIKYFTEELDGVISTSQYGNANGSGRIKVYTSEEAVIYPLKVAGIQVNKANADDVLGDGTVVYDPTTNTLTLNNADFFVEQGNYGIRAEGSLNIELKGTNRIESEDYYGIAVIAASDGSTPNVIIGGEGSLESVGTDAGILVRGNLTICDSAKVTSRCGDITEGTAYGIRVYTDLHVCDSAELTVKSGAAPEYSYGVYAGNDLTISGNAKVTTEAGMGVGRSCGAYAISNIFIKDQAQLITKGIDNSEAGNYASESYGIRTTQMYVSGGSVEATGQGATGISAGIYTQEMEISGGTVTVSSVDAKTGQSVGIQSIRTLYVSGGTLITTSGDTTSDSWAIDASGELKVTGGKVIAKTGTGDRTYGIYADTAIVSGGHVEAKAEDAVSQSRGIQAMNGLTISGGYVDAAAGNADSQSYGIQSGTSVDITGGIVTASSGTTNRKSSAIYSGGDISIKDAKVEVTSKGNGIHAPYGKINIGCTEVTVSTNSPTLAGTKVVITALGEALSAETEPIIDKKLVKRIPVEGKLVIEPLGYAVSIKGLSNDLKVIIAAGKSVYDLYPEFDRKLNPTKEGYEFGGFYTDEACSEGKKYDFGSIVDADITIYAKWTEKIVTPEVTPDVTPEETPDKTPEDNPVKKPDSSGTVNTGDSSMIMLWLAAAVLSMGTVLFVRRNRQ